MWYTKLNLTWKKQKIKKQIMSFEIFLLLLINFFGLSYLLFQKDAHFEKKPIYKSFMRNKITLLMVIKIK
jgi:hypothetical protein